MPDRRSVVLVTVDSLRADHCGFMGYDRDVTPTLDRMARRGLSFRDAVAPGPATGRSVPPTLTGAFPVEPGAGEWADEPWGERVRRHLRTRETVAERFARMGYHTGAFTTNPWTSRYYGFDAGFDDFEDFVGDGDGGTPTLRGDGVAARVGGHLRDWWSNDDVFLPWEAYFDDVRAWLADAERPYFLWLFLIDVHMPYHPPRAHRSRSALATIPAHLWLLSGGDPRFAPLFRSRLLDAYDDTVRYADRFLDRLLSTVGTEPLVVVHADHGEAFGERGSYGHGADLSEPVVRVPLVVANGPEGRVDRPVSLRRLPTLLTGLARGERPDVTAPYVFTGTPERLAVRGASWKYVRGPDGSALYSVADGEETPLENDRLASLGAGLLDRWEAGRAEKARVRAAAGRVAGTGRL